MSSSSRVRWLSAFVVMVGLGLGAQAHAGGKVDWSDYLEPPGSRPPMKKATSVAEETPAKVGKKSARAKPAKKKAAAKAKRARPARKHR